ncbi:MAG: hypothetical protein ACRDZ6_02905 [Acidimicrobiales bacterium]
MDHTDPEVEVVPKRARPTRRFPAAYKARILEEYDRLDKAEKGALLRREGLYSSLLSEWRKQRDRGGMAELAQVGGTSGRRPPRQGDRQAPVRQQAPDRRARQGPQDHRGPGKTLSAVGAARHRRRAGGEGRDEVTQLVDGAVAGLEDVSVPTRTACEAVGVSRAGWYRRHRQSAAPPRRESVRAPQPQALTEVERKEVHATLNSEEFCDDSSATAYAKLLDQGIYVASVPTMYRVLRAHDEVGDGRRHATHPASKKPELIAEAPNQVWSWDISKPLGPVKWTYFWIL